MGKWGQHGYWLVVLLQTIICCHLYFTQVSLISRLDSLLPLEDDSLLRSRREVRSAAQNSSNDLSITANNSTAVVTSSEVANTSVERTSTRHARKKSNKKSHRLPVVEKFLVSTESTTAGPVMIRSSRTKATHGARLRSGQRVFEAAALREEMISAEFAPHIPPASIHFVSDASNYTRERHSHYAGNGRIKVSGIYTDWRPAEWTHTLKTNQHFRLNRGKLTLKQAGLYLFYSQIHYANVQEVNCYRAILNEATVAQCCSTTAHPDRHEIKANTCSLLTTLYLQPDDTLWLSDLHERFVILTPEKSYFGLVHLYSPPTNTGR